MGYELAANVLHDKEAASHQGGNQTRVATRPLQVVAAGATSLNQTQTKDEENG